MANGSAPLMQTAKCGEVGGYMRRRKKKPVGSSEQK